MSYIEYVEPEDRIFSWKEVLKALIKLGRPIIEVAKAFPREWDWKNFSKKVISIPLFQTPHYKLTLRPFFFFEKSQYFLDKKGPLHLAFEVRENGQAKKDGLEIVAISNKESWILEDEVKRATEFLDFLKFYHKILVRVKK